MRTIYLFCCTLFLFGGCAFDPHHRPGESELPAPSRNVIPVISPARWQHQAIKLLDGRILVLGGSLNGIDSENEIAPPNDGLIIDPVTGDVQTTGICLDRSYGTATLLYDGRVLIAGGQSRSYPQLLALDHVEIYDPVRNQFESTSRHMINARRMHTATLLEDGKVLLAGGEGNTLDLTLIGCELFNPATGTFLDSIYMVHGRAFHSAALLNSGQVLIAGGSSGWGGAQRIAELFDPASYTFRELRGIAAINYTYQNIAIKLHSGKVLLLNANGSPSIAVLYNPETEAFEETGSLLHSRVGAAVTFLEETGEVLVTGGYVPGTTLGYTPVMEMEIYNPSKGVFEEFGTLSRQRYYHTATLISNNKVLLVGGIGSDRNPIEQCEFVQIK